jgi:hypothetical protein
MLILHHKRNLAKKGGATSIHFGVEQGATTRLGTRDMRFRPHRREDLIEDGVKWRHSALLGGQQQDWQNCGLVGQYNTPMV